MLRWPIQHLYPLEIGCQKDSVDSQPEKTTTDVDIEDNQTPLSTSQSENQDPQIVVETLQGGRPCRSAAIEA